MHLIAQIYAAHPFWVWLAVGAVLLAVEAATGSGYLLWAAAAAAITALFALLRLGPELELAVFALVTLAAIVLARRYLPHPFRPRGPDINAPRHRILGHRGSVVAPFDHGHGRVFVDGKEWAAELDDGGELAAGAPVEVTAVVSGSRLKVRAA